MGFLTDMHRRAVHTQGGVALLVTVLTALSVLFSVVVTASVFFLLTADGLAWRMAIPLAIGIPLLAAPLSILLLVRATRENVLLREAAERQARNFERQLARRNEVIAMIAHNLRAPMSSLELAARTMARDPQNEDNKLLTVQMASVATDALTLLEQLLAQLERGELEESTWDVAAKLPGWLVAHDTAARLKEQRLELVLPDGAVVSDAPQLWVRQIVENLVSNAVKFAPAQTIVRVALETKPGRVLVRVTDQGPGVEPADRPRLFRMRQPLSAKPTGGETTTGLGLALSAQLAQKFGAAIAYVDRPEPGAEFVLEWPAQGGGSRVPW